MRVISINKERPASVTVNGVVITPEAIAAEAQNHPMPKDKPGWAWRAAAHALVLREVLLQQAKACNIKADPIELSDGLWETDEEAVIRQLLEQEITYVPVNESSLREIYNRAPERFRAPSLFEAAHILFAASQKTPPARAKARSEAKLVLAELLKDDRRFASLAKEHSDCPSGANGGILGQLSSGDTVPEFEAALVSMKQGEICEKPIETRYGYHIIRLDAHAVGQPLPFESVLPQLRQAQEKANWVHAGRNYMENLTSKANITGIDLSDTPWAKTLMSA